MAVQDPTTNYNWNIPDVGLDVGTWGGILRTIIGDDVTGVDAVLKAVSNVANAALPLAGGTLTGALKQKVARYTSVNLGATITGATNIDCSAGDYFYGTVTGNPTFTFTNEPTSGDVQFVMLELTNLGAFTVTWDGGVQWTGGTEPTWTAAGTDIITFVTRDAGTTWHGAIGIQASA